MRERICCICKAQIESENPAVLTVSSLGNPRYLCDSCDADFSSALTAKEYSEIKDAVSSIGGKMEASGVEDELVIEEAGVIIERATARAEAIRDGSYDFSLDEESSEDSPLEEAELLVEEAEESEEEREKRLQKERYAKIFDTATTWTIGIAIVAAIGYLIYKLIF